MVKTKNNTPSLVHTEPVRVRFSEVDFMRIVWHGEYVRYFEDGREAFGRRFDGIGYMDIYEAGYMAPIVDLKLQFKSPLRVGDSAVVETRYINTDAAKICFEYEIRREPGGEIMATGSTMQVFTDMDGRLELTNPEFYLNWKRRWNVI